MTDTITVYKQDHLGNTTWHYTGVVLAKGKTWLRLEASYNGPERDDGYTVWQHGDKFVEYFFSDRWYNIFEIHDTAGDVLKGWYCNITYPPRITRDSVRWRDLALDMWISPSGDVLVLDESEFAKLEIDTETRLLALAAVEKVRAHVVRREEPFNKLP